MSEIDWKQLLSKNDPIGTDSPFYVSDLPFTQKIAESYSSIKFEDKGYLGSLFKDKIVVDLGSGNPKQATFIRQLACKSEAKEYVGIDMNYPRAELFGEYPGSRVLQFTESCGGYSLLSTYLREDMQVALQKLETYAPDSNYIFVLVGIETIGGENHKPLAETLFRLCSSDGAILLGPGTHGILFTKFGFKLERRVVKNGCLFFEIYS